MYLQLAGVLLTVIHIKVDNFIEQLGQRAEMASVDIHSSYRNSQKYK